MPDSPNLLFLWTDQQAARTMGAYGNEAIETPNLDALADENVTFDRAYCSQPVCTPARSTILTGLYPHATGCTENNVRLPAHVPTFPEMGDFEDYATAFMGKWHLGDEVFAQRGFDEWVSIDDMYRSHYGPDRDPEARSTYSEFLIENGFEPDVRDEDGFERFSRRSTRSPLTSPARRGGSSGTTATNRSSCTSGSSSRTSRTPAPGTTSTTRPRCPSRRTSNTTASTTSRSGPD